MNRTKFLISLVLALSVLIGQVGTVVAAPLLQDSPPIVGTVQSITLETDPNTGITTVIVEVRNANQTVQSVRISQSIALTMGLVAHDGDGNPVINNAALGKHVEIKQAAVIPDEKKDRHPVGDALATFFFESLSVGNEEIYDAIMDAHDKGIGFGVIAQALWLTEQGKDELKEVGNSLDIFNALLEAKQSNNYEAFSMFSANGAAPTNWGQLRKAILHGKKIDKPATASNQDSGHKQNKDKAKGKDKDKNKDSGSGGSNSPGNDKDKEKNK